MPFTFHLTSTVFLFKASIDFGLLVGKYLIKTNRNNGGRIVLYNNAIYLSEPQIVSILALNVTQFKP